MEQPFKTLLWLILVIRWGLRILVKVSQLKQSTLLSLQVQMLMLGSCPGLSMSFSAVLVNMVSLGLASNLSAAESSQGSPSSSRPRRGCSRETSSDNLKK